MHVPTTFFTTVVSKGFAARISARLALPNQSLRRFRDTSLQALPASCDVSHGASPKLVFSIVNVRKLILFAQDQVEGLTDEELANEITKLESGERKVRFLNEDYGLKMSYAHVWLKVYRREQEDRKKLREQKDRKKTTGAKKNTEG
jgi:hypothetical protein